MQEDITAAQVCSKDSMGQRYRFRVQLQLGPIEPADLEFDVTQDAPQKNIAKAGNVIIPTTTFVLSNLACRLEKHESALHPIPKMHNWNPKQTVSLISPPSLSAKVAAQYKSAHKSPCLSLKLTSLASSQGGRQGDVLCHMLTMMAS